MCENFIAGCIHFEQTSIVRLVLIIAEQAHNVWHIRELMFTLEVADSEEKDSRDKSVRRKSEQGVFGRCWPHDRES